MPQRILCDLCNRHISPHGHYIVRIDVYADPEMPPVTKEEMEAADYQSAMAELMKQLQGMTAEELQDQVHRRFEFKICRPCQMRFLANPLESRGRLARPTIDMDDASEPWPDLQDLSDAMRWAMPREFGGDELDPIELHVRYEQLARRSLSLALILTQRDSGVGIIAAGGHRRLLDEIQRGAFVTVGIAQLTTSRQGGAPALKLKDGRLRGVIPWATGAAKAKYIVVGAVTDGGQVLLALASDATGVTIEPPMPLVALRDTWTSSIRCDNVAIADDMILLGPAANVLSLRRKSVPIAQVFLALGLSRAALNLIAGHDSDRARKLHERFSAQVEALHGRVIDACRPEADAALVPLLRGQCNDLALRITHSAVALYKGTALLLSHPAQRLAREALFLLVWSCPDPVIDCTVDILSNG